MGFNSVVVEVAIGLAVVFFLVATIAAAVNQVISRWTDARAKTLWQSLAKLLAPAPTVTAPVAAAAPAALPAGADIGTMTAIKMGLGRVDARPNGTTNDPLDELLATPSIRALDPVDQSGKPTKVDNIPPQVFATALLELAKIKGSPDDATVEAKLVQLANAYPNTPIATFAASIASGIGNDIDRFFDTTGSWFDGQMSRLSQVYRKNTRWILLLIGLVAAVLFNVDAIQLGNTLRQDSNLRSGVLTISEQIGDTGGVTADCTIPVGQRDRELECAREALNSLNGLEVPIIGTWTWDTWKDGWTDNAPWHIIGLLLTAGAVSLGAPFWFDTLKRLAGFRRSG
jgi:hypothetical protein